MKNKIDRSSIMKRAWEFVKKGGFTLSEGLKKAWQEAKYKMLQVFKTMSHTQIPFKKAVESIRERLIQLRTQKFDLLGGIN